MSEELAMNKVLNDGTRHIKSVKGSRITTLDQLLAFAEVDLRVWEVERQKVNKWEVAMKGVDGESHTTDLFQICAWLRLREGLSLESIAESTIKQMEAHAPDYSKLTLARERVKPYARTGKLLELDLFDVHIGLLSWPPETGENYDTDIAGSRYMRTLNHLLKLAESYSPEAILLPTGNDFLHIDTERGSTTGDTTVDVDTRATKVFERGKTLMIAAIDRLLTVTPKVMVPIVPGNHDRFSMLHLGHVLAAWYRNAGAAVEIDFSPRLRKYIEWGKCLIGYTHGSEEKKARLPMIMAHEQRDAWSRTSFRTWRIGHWHHTSTLLLPVGDTMDGVWVKQCAALAPRDAWHTKKGFVCAPSGASATLWDKDEGNVIEFQLSGASVR